MEPYFRMFGDGKDIHSIVDEVLRIVRSNQLDFDAKSIYEFDLVKDRIVYVLVNKERNEDLIEFVPYRDFTEELIITYKILLDNVVDGSATIQIRNEFLEMWNVSENDLFDDTMYNEGLINDINMYYLQMLYDLCKNNNVDLMLTKLPRWYSTFPNGCNEQLLDFSKNNNIIYKDLQTEMNSYGIIYSDYEDTQHLNAYGAEKLSANLGKFIQDTYNLPNHSSDSQYIKEYSKKSERYRKAIENK